MHLPAAGRHRRRLDSGQDHIRRWIQHVRRLPGNRNRAGVIFRQRNRRRTDEMLGLFQNLFSLEDQILNMFVPRERAVQRYVFTR